MYRQDHLWYPIGGQQGKITTFLLLLIAIGIIGFGMFALWKVKNTIVIVNEAAEKPRAVFLAGNNEPDFFEEQVETNKKLQILQTQVGYLNVREEGSLRANRIGRVKPGEVYEYIEAKDNWYHIVHPDFENGWVSGLYVEEVDRSSDLFQ